MAAVGAVSQVFDKEGNYIGVGIKLHDKVAMLRELLKHISSRADDEETLQAGLALTRLLERRLREQKKLGAKQKMHYQAFSKAGSEL